MKFFYNILGTVFLALAVFYLVNTDWWKVIFCFIVGFMFIGIGFSGIVNDKKYNDLENVVNALVFRVNHMNEEGKK